MFTTQKRLFGNVLLVIVLAISLNINAIAYNFGSTTFNDLGHELLNRNFDDGLAHWSVSGGSAGTTSSGFRGAAVYLTTSSVHDVRLSQSLDSSLVSRIRGKTLTFSFMFKSAVVGDQARAMVRYTYYEPASGGGGGGGGGGGRAPLPTPGSVAPISSGTGKINALMPPTVKPQVTSTSPVHGYLYGSWENRSTDSNMPWRIVSGSFSIPVSENGYQIEEIAVIISVRNIERRNAQGYIQRNVHGYIDSAEIAINSGKWFDGYLHYLYYTNKRSPQEEIARVTYGIDVNIFSLGDLPGSNGMKKIMLLGISTQAHAEDGLGIDQTDLKIQLLPTSASSSTQKGKLDALDVIFADNRLFSTETNVDNRAQDLAFRLTKLGLSILLYKALGPYSIPVKIATTVIGVDDEIDGMIDTAAGVLVGRSDSRTFDTTADAYSNPNDDIVCFKVPSFNSFPMGGTQGGVFYNVAYTSTVSTYLLWIYDTGYSGYGLSISAKFHWGFWASDESNTWYKNNEIWTTLDYSLMVS